MPAGDHPRAGFNANERSQRREAGVVSIGDRTYHPIRLSNARLREVRQLSRNADDEAREVGRETKEYRLAYDAARADGKSEAEATKAGDDAARFSDEADVVNERAVVQQLTRLLVDDDMQPPTIEQMTHHVQHDLDTRDQIPLLNYLMGEDPLDSGQTGTTTS